MCGIGGPTRAARARDDHARPERRARARSAGDVASSRDRYVQRHDHARRHRPRRVDLRHDRRRDDRRGRARDRRRAWAMAHVTATIGAISGDLDDRASRTAASRRSRSSRCTRASRRARPRSSRRSSRTRTARIPTAIADRGARRIRRVGIDTPATSPRSRSGSSEITATQDGVTSAPTTITVTAAELTSLAIGPASPHVALGFTEQLAANGLYTDRRTSIPRP